MFIYLNDENPKDILITEQIDNYHCCWKLVFCNISVAPHFLYLGDWNGAFSVFNDFSKMDATHKFINSCNDLLSAIIYPKLQHCYGHRAGNFA